MAPFGVMSENARKLMSGDDSGDTLIAKDKTLLDVLHKKIIIKLGQILNNHSLFALRRVNSYFEYVIKFSKAEGIMVAQSSQSVAGNVLNDFCL